MTTTQEIPQAPPAPPAPPPSAKPRRSRTLPIAAGSGLAVIGGLLALAGGGLLSITGDDGSIGTGTHEFATPTAALVSSAAEIEDTNEVADVLGRPSIGVDAKARAGGADVFVGVGPSKAVDRYLARAPVDRVTDLDVAPFELTKDRRDGARRPAPPTTQTFWVAQSNGRTAAIDWKVRDGSYKFVVMNADGSRNVATDGSFDVEVPHLSAIATAALVTGLVGILAGMVLILALGIDRGPRTAGGHPQPVA